MGLQDKTELEIELLNLQCSASLYDEGILRWMEIATKAIEKQNERIGSLEYQLRGKKDEL